jgi:hypothetical protein
MSGGISTQGGDGSVEGGVQAGAGAWRAWPGALAIYARATYARAKIDLAKLTTLGCPLGATADMRELSFNVRFRG